MIRKLTSLIVLALLLLAGGHAAAQEQYWQVIKERQLKMMSQFERVQYNKAFNLLKSDQFRAAANEFERFKEQYKDSEVLPYIVFFQAYSLHLAKDRNKAITIFNEVVDFFPGVIDAAAPALYYRGVAQIANGDYTKGMSTMNELLRDENYKNHPVAASASLQLVRNHWKNNDPQKANRDLRRIFKNHRQNSPKAAADAKAYYMAYCAATGNIREYVAWYNYAYKEQAEEKKISPAQFKVNMINDMYQLIMNWHSWNQFFNDEMLLRYRAGKKGPNPQQELWIFIRDNEADYNKAGRMWDFFYNSLSLLSRHYNRKFISPVAFDKLVNNAINFVKSEADLPQTKNRQQKRFASLVELLYGNREWGQGERVNANLKDEKTRAWNEYRAMYGKAEDRHANATFNDCVQKLEGIAAKFATDPGMVSRALSSKAYIYHHKIGKYEEAIKAYQELSRPPETLYNIADCQKRLKKSQEALRTYAEIAGSFPREAPNAFWHMGEYYRQLGDQKRAVATYRAILRRHPKSPQASWSHQVLERLGIDETGLGADEDF